MKRYIIPFIILLLSLSSCDILDTYDKSKISPDDYFRNKNDFEMFSNTFYNNLLDKNPYEEQSDQYVELTLSKRLNGGNFRTVPDDGGGWDWEDLRKINTMLGHMHQCPDKDVVAQYSGVARFFRAYFYFEKVKKFGDVPWVDKELQTDSPELFKPRDSRELVLSKMIEDIDYAIENLPNKVSTYRVCKWTALAFKARFCLYEGTFRKYHKLNIEGHDYKYYLTLAADAAKKLIDSGVYKLAPDYGKLFAEPDADAGEYILAIRNDRSLSIFNNSTAYATMPTQGKPGLTKKFVDSFLMKDGSRFTDKPGWDKMTFKDEVANRDPRLYYCTVTPGYKRIGGTDVVAPDLGASATGFQLAKYVMDCNLPDVNRVEMSYNDMPVFRLAEVYLNYAEAKAELETLTQEDLDISINLLRKRVNMPNMSLSEANANPDPYLSSEEYGYRNVEGANKGIILEIRRERSVELAQESFRWNDLMRWKEGLCINQKMYGMYFPGPGEYDLSGDGIPDLCLYDTDKKPSSKFKGIVFKKIGDATTGILLSEGNKGYIDPHQNIQHIFDESRDYFYPIPINQRTYNHNLTQNPGWKDGLGF